MSREPLGAAELSSGVASGEALGVPVDRLGEAVPDEVGVEAVSSWDAWEAASGSRARTSSARPSRAGASYEKRPLTRPAATTAATAAAPAPTASTLRRRRPPS